MKLKRIIATGLCVCLAFSMSACSKKKTGNGGNTTEEQGEVKLADISSVDVYESDAEVTDDELDAMIDNLLESYASEAQVTEGKTKLGDKVNIDYVGKFDGEAFEGGTAEGVSITLGSSGYIDGFDDGLVDQKIGDTVDLNLRFPDDYQPEPSYAGKDCVFTVTINYVSTKDIPKLNNKFVKKNIEKYYGVSTADDLKEFIRNKLRTSKITSAFWESYVEKCEVVKYNETEVQSLVDDMEAYYEQQYQQQYSVDIDTFLEAASQSREDWDKKNREEAEASIKEKMVVNKIAEENNLVTDEAYEKTGLVYCQSYRTESIEDLKKQYGEEQVDYVIKYTIVTDWLATQIKLIEGERPTEAPTETEAATEAATEAKTEETTEAEGEVSTEAE